MLRLAVASPTYPQLLSHGHLYRLTPTWRAQWILMVLMLGRPYLLIPLLPPGHALEAATGEALRARDQGEIAPAGFEPATTAPADHSIGLFTYRLPADAT